MTYSNHSENSNIHILIVDDNQMNRQIIEYIFQFVQGYSYESAASGLEAWEMLLANPTGFDIAIIDGMMPGIDGITLTAQIRQHPELQHLPIILQSGKTDSYFINSAMDAGASLYLKKPYSDNEMIAAIKQCVA